MDAIRFEWDASKATANEAKHHVSFEEARTFFSDPYARVIDDPDHSSDEARFVILGMSQVLRLLVVCNCYRLENQTIRIISARRATSREAHSYGN